LWSLLPATCGFCWAGLRLLSPSIADYLTSTASYLLQDVIHCCRGCGGGARLKVRLAGRVAGSLQSPPSNAELNAVCFPNTLGETRLRGHLLLITAQTGELHSKWKPAWPKDCKAYRARLGSHMQKRASKMNAALH
jgi:hypothetical protein